MPLRNLLPFRNRPAAPPSAAHPTPGGLRGQQQPLARLISTVSRLWRPHLSPAVPGNIDSVPPPLPNHLNGKMRYHLLEQGGIQVSSVDKESYSIALVETLINTRFCIAGLNGLGQKIGMDLRQKLQEKVEQSERHRSQGIKNGCFTRRTARYPTSQEYQHRLDVLNGNLSELNPASEPVLHTLRQAKPMPIQLAARALLAVLPLNLLSPSAFKTWVEHRQKMNPGWTLLRGPEGESFSVQTLGDLVYLANGGGDLGSSVLCTVPAAVLAEINPETCDSPRMNATSDDVQCWVRCREAWRNDENLVYEARQGNPGLLTVLRSLIPRDRQYWADPQKDEAVIKKFRQVEQTQKRAKAMGWIADTRFDHRSLPHGSMPSHPVAPPLTSTISSGHEAVSPLSTAYFTALQTFTSLDPASPKTQAATPFQTEIEPYE